MPEYPFFPMFVDLSRRRVLSVGGGRIAARRVSAALSVSGGRVVIVALADGVHPVDSLPCVCLLR